MNDNRIALPCPSNCVKNREVKIIYSNSDAAFGLGAKIPPQFRESQEFCLNLETDPYCRGLSSVFSAFKTSFVNVQPLNMAHLSHVIYYVAKLAQNSLSRASPGLSSGNEAIADYNAPNYFVLVIITRGVFDDLKETIQAIIFASRSPISIIFVEICNDQKREEIIELERLATAGTRLNYHGRKPERDCTQYVSIPSCRFEESKQNELKYLIAERGLSTIGQQMCTWMVRNGYQKVPPTVDVQMLDPLLTDVPAQNISLTVQSNSCGQSTSNSSNATTISRSTFWKRSLFNQFSLRRFRKTSKQRNQNNQKFNSEGNRSTSN
ncbi:hypothetical protein ACQ4LE_002324 [Meloidogyne hapla]